MELRTSYRCPHIQYKRLTLVPTSGLSCWIVFHRSTPPVNIPAFPELRVGKPLVSVKVRHHERAAPCCDLRLAWRSIPIPQGEQKLISIHVVLIPRWSLDTRHLRRDLGAMVVDDGLEGLSTIRYAFAISRPVRAYSHIYKIIDPQP